MKHSLYLKNVKIQPTPISEVLSTGPGPGQCWGTELLTDFHSLDFLQALRRLGAGELSLSPSCEISAPIFLCAGILFFQCLFIYLAISQFSPSVVSDSL